MDLYFQRNNNPDTNVRSEKQITTDGDSSLPAAYLSGTRVYVIFQRGTTLRKIYTDDVWSQNPTWQGDTVALTNAGDPDVVYDEAANYAHLAYWYSNAIYYARSNDGLSTWKNGNDTTITDGANGTQVVTNITTEQSPAISLDAAGVLRISYKDSSNVLQHKKSSDFGKSWTAIS